MLDPLLEKENEIREFRDINFMRKQLGMPLLEKGFVKCMGSCGEKFFSFDKKGNRMCDTCKGKPKINMYADVLNSHTLVDA